MSTKIQITVDQLNEKLPLSDPRKEKLSRLMRLSVFTSFFFKQLIN